MASGVRFGRGNWTTMGAAFRVLLGLQRCQRDSGPWRVQTSARGSPGRYGRGVGEHGVSVAVAEHTPGGFMGERLSPAHSKLHDIRISSRASSTMTFTESNTVEAVVCDALCGGITHHTSARGPGAAARPGGGFGMVLRRGREACRADPRGAGGGPCAGRPWCASTPKSPRSPTAPKMCCTACGPS